MGSAGWLAQFIPGARNDIVCRSDGTIRKAEPQIGWVPSCFLLVARGVTLVVVFAFSPQKIGNLAGTYEWYFVILWIRFSGGDNQRTLEPYHIFNSEVVGTLNHLAHTAHAPCTGHDPTGHLEKLSPPNIVNWVKWCLRVLLIGWFLFYFWVIETEFWSIPCGNWTNRLDEFQSVSFSFWMVWIIWFTVLCKLRAMQFDRIGFW